MKRESIARLSEARILVIGDWMTDVWVDGVVERISPEAPVPVFRETGRVERDGGAGNLVGNILALGASPVACYELLAQNLRRATIKIRYRVGGQQLFRADSEDTTQITGSVESKVLAFIDASARNCDIIAISDYGKGVVTRRVVAAAVETGKRVVVDPSGSNFALYEGAYAIKANRKELHELVPLTQDDSKAAVGLARLAGALVVGTLGDSGMIVAKPGGKDAPRAILAHPVPVADVTGAGDTAMAALCASLAVGLDLYEAAEIANLAACIAVSKRGTATVSAEELTKAFERL